MHFEQEKRLTFGTIARNSIYGWFYYWIMQSAFLKKEENYEQTIQ
jgi:hypothetical protein